MSLRSEVKSIMEKVEAIPGIRIGSTSIELSQLPLGLYFMIRAVTVHRTRRGPVRIAGQGYGHYAAIADIRKSALQATAAAARRESRRAKT